MNGYIIAALMLTSLAYAGMVGSSMMTFFECLHARDYGAAAFWVVVFLGLVTAGATSFEALIHG